MTDLERFIQLYADIGIELKPSISTNDQYGYQSLILQQGNNEKLVGYSGFSSYIYFDENGKFLQQVFWE